MTARAIAHCGLKTDLCFYHHTFMFPLIIVSCTYTLHLIIAVKQVICVLLWWTGSWSGIDSTGEILLKFLEKSCSFVVLRLLFPEQKVNHCTIYSIKHTVIFHLLHDVMDYFKNYFTWKNFSLFYVESAGVILDRNSVLTIFFSCSSPWASLCPIFKDQHVNNTLHCQFRKSLQFAKY